MEEQQTEAETQQLWKEIEQRQKPSIYGRKANRDRKPAFTEGERTETEIQ
jgi:hypothetical protein